MAAASKARKAQEAKDLARKNKEMKRRLEMHRQTQRTDDNLDDEEAGRARAEYAARSKARREQEERALDKANNSIFGKINKTGVRTDDDIMGTNVYLTLNICTHTHTVTHTHLRHLTPTIATLPLQLPPVCAILMGDVRVW